ncbi:hypothetical protein DH2020_027779 [Rehmannia glutinosa]|uniref:Homeobox domain-containing protein n=1 Tax=Rehmannia glutinosa TaxID=99300 RepID=A0ABR0VU70_REHGL
MAMYYQGSSEIQGDHNLQTLYLMNPNYVGYSDTQHPPLYSNSAAGAPHAPPHQFVGIPLSHDPSRPSPAQEHIQAVHYNIWGLVDHHHQSAYGSTLNQPNTPQQETPKPLSLSLTPHETINQDFLGQIISPKNNNCSSSSLTTNDHQSNGVINRVESVIMGSKYVKAARELLDEVANVGNGAIIIDKAKMVYKETSVCKNGDALSGGGGDSGNKNGGAAAAELTTAQRQEIQMKKAKLNSMLDEVEQRYKQYHHQMQMVVASFEQVAGIGSAKSYTRLALKTILKQFRCLKNTISHQIKTLSKSLGEEENSGTKIEGSRLKFVDHQLRQQRTLQQLGMMQNNAWRPQRGLPERAVSVLRAWLFEHFLHPYPKDSDKHMLAKQTGLTRSQVSNWFINARVRLWKPMVEDMYLEEMKTNQEKITPDQDNTTKHEPDRELGSKLSNPRQENNITPPILKNLVNNPSPSDISASTVITSPTGPSFQPRPGFAQLINSLNTEKYPKKPRHENQADNSPSSILSVDHVDKPGRSFTFSANNQGQIGENYLSGFDSTYGNIISELPDRFNNPTGFQGNNNNNNFSLTLAPPTLQGVHQQNFFEFGTRIGSSEVVESNRVNGINNLQASHDHSNVGNYQILDFQNRKLFHNHFVA